MLPRDDPRVAVVIVTGSCCIPGMAPFDEQARRAVAQAIAQTGIPAALKEIAATSAFFGAVPRNVMTGLLAAFNQTGQVGLPAVLVNGALVAAGVPDVETIKAALHQAASREVSKEERAHG